MQTGLRNHTNRPRTRGGFTIVELVIVIVVIAILATLASIGLASIQREARDEQRSSNVDIIAEALEKYFTENGEYPSCQSLQAAPATVTGTGGPLAGVDQATIVMPQAAAGVENSFECSALAAGTGTDAIGYISGDSTSCLSTACSSFVLQYRSEEDGTIKTVTSRHQGGVVVTTVAGTTSGYLDGPGDVAQFYYPNGLVADSLGNIYVADASNYRIRKISPTGAVTTLSGSGTNGWNSGAPNVAQFSLPRAIAISPSGELHVGDLRVRKVTADGTVSVLAGSTTTGANDGLGTAAQFKLPYAMTFDSAGNAYVSDMNNERIRKITPAGDVSTPAGSTTGLAQGTGAAAQFSNPAGIAINSTGTYIFIVDVNNNCVRKMTPTGTVSLFAGTCLSQGLRDGSSTVAWFKNPKGLVIDKNNNLYVADTGNNVIRKITPAGDVTTIAGSGVAGSADGPGLSAQFNQPQGITIDATGALYVSDTNNHRIRKILL